MTARMVELDAKLLKLVKACGQRGFTVEPMDGYTEKQVRCCIDRLVREGQVWKGKSGHRTMRIFARKEHADAFSSSRVTAASIQADRSRQRSIRSVWGDDTPVTFHPNFKLTVAPPAPDPIRTNTHTD
jgi:hypothetical protein